MSLPLWFSESLWSSEPSQEEDDPGSLETQKTQDKTTPQDAASRPDKEKDPDAHFEGQRSTFTASHQTLFTGAFKRKLFNLLKISKVLALVFLKDIIALTVLRVLI